MAEVLQWRGRKRYPGTKVTLGGSTVFNLADMANTYGLGDDKVDRYKAVYNTFGNLMVKMYPSLMPTFMPYEKAVDKSFLFSVISNHRDCWKEGYTDELCERNYF